MGSSAVARLVGGYVSAEIIDSKFSQRERWEHDRSEESWLDSIAFVSMLLAWVDEPTPWIGTCEWDVITTLEM